MTFYVYVAGPMSGTPAEYLANCHRLSATSRALMDMGFCPINPAGDMLEGLMGGTPLTDEQYKSRSMDLLRLLAGKPAAVYVTGIRHRDGTLSSGVDAECAEARRLGLEVVGNLSVLSALRQEIEEP